MGTATGTGPVEGSPMELASADELADEATIVRARGRGLETDFSEIVKLLAGQAVTAGLLVGERHSGSPEFDVEKYLVPRTRLFINQPKAVDIGWSMATAAALFALCGAPPAAAAAVAFQQALRIMRVLSEEEADLVVVLAALSGGRAYDQATSTERILAAYEEDHSRAEALLTAMARRGILAEDHRGWRLER